MTYDALFDAVLTLLKKQILFVSLADLVFRSRFLVSASMVDLMVAVRQEYYYHLNCAHSVAIDSCHYVLESTLSASLKAVYD